MSDSSLADRSATSCQESRGGRAARSPLSEDIISTETQPDETVGLPTSRASSRLGDKIFRATATASGGFIVALIAAIGVFLLLQAIPALQANKASFLFSGGWETGDAESMSFGIAYLLWITIATSAVALVIAMPVSLGIALFLTQYAPRGMARSFAYVVDLLAAVPSIVFGLWGVQVLGPALLPVAAWLNTNLGFIPLFGVGNLGRVNSTGTVFVAGVVLAVMILPIITGVSREVFGRTPSDQIEGALALGATKWEMVRTTVLPFGRSGYISAAMLGLGRALGETVALYMILSGTGLVPKLSLFDGGSTIASKIALDSSEFNNPISAGAYIAAGLVLFLLTFVVNAIARAIANGKQVQG
jgi:phosphate transport system permease protein